MTQCGDGIGRMARRAGNQSFGECSQGVKVALLKRNFNAQYFSRETL